MDDLNDKLARLLSSPDSLSKIQSAMAALGGTDGDLQGLLSGVAAAPAAAQEPSAASQPAPSAGGLPDLTILTKLAPLLSGLGQEDDDTRLLHALRPYLRGERERRLDETVQLLRLTKLLPLLQMQGLLSGSKKEGEGGHG